MGFQFTGITGAKTAQQLVSFCRQLADAKQPYWYGTCVYLCTSSLLKSKTAQYPDGYPSSMNSKRQSDIAKGNIACDCVGMIKGFAWWNVAQNKPVRNGVCADMGATNMYNSCKEKGVISNIPEIPGLCVWKTGHIGIYIGGGLIVEAKGRNYGVIYSNLKGTTFTHWGKLPFIDYVGAGDIPTTPPTEFEPYNAVVATRNVTGASLWNNTKKEKSLLLIPRGDTIYVTENLGTWVKAEKNGVIGYMDKTYVSIIGDVYDITTSLKVGSSGTNVIKLQQYLSILGYDTGIIDGKFGSLTEIAVKDFQRTNALVVDGIVGTKTWSALGTELGKIYHSDVVDDDDTDDDTDDQTVPSQNPDIIKNDENLSITVICHSTETYQKISDIIDQFVKESVK